MSLTCRPSEQRRRFRAARRHRRTPPHADNDMVPPLAALLGIGTVVVLSHVNDAGFWLVKEYFGMTVGQTLATWSVMETIISVSGLICVLLLNLIV